MNTSILITGCTHGIGNALTLRFAKAGHKVYSVGRDKKLLEELTNSNLITPILCDITNETSKEIISKAIQNEKSISIIHNAGIAKPSLITELPADLLRKHFETNLYAPILLTQHLLSFLKKDSRVLHITSAAADLALAGMMPYCASKAALERATHCLNQELNPKEIYFANLRPGIVDTNMQKKLREEDESNLPIRKFYIEAKNNNILIPPEIAAEFIFWVMTRTTNDDFSKTLWNIYELKYRDDWHQKDIANNWTFLN
jgi:benzil reductase ((S)-benzoin forming)